ncbi:MAG TPA: helix-turn-helix domain-containing GNAT family N-acetyltransferase [Burkholderiaceae bacterium]|nr:helix-turn-helix domain-containing GNAT family N-acetyltransferase [Burkholderiaceae bacterium]
MSIESDVLERQIAVVRRFSRFYTRQLGLLNKGLYKTRYSLTEARIIFELAQRDGLTASELARELSLDAGYLSRLLKKFHAKGLLERSVSPQDGRQAVLALTAQGRDLFQALNRYSHEEVAGMLAGLSGGERQSLADAMLKVQRLMGAEEEPGQPYLIRSLQPGDIGAIARQQGLLYHREYGWDIRFEALVAEILAHFVASFDPDRERAWVVEKDGEVIGSVFVVKESETVAKLRLLYVDQAARGLGLGRRLVQECIDFARSRQYRTLTLWTNDVLASARRIYQAAGFRLVQEEPHHSFGKDLVGQNWDLDL